jgi:hypothetical protein
MTDKDGQPASPRLFKRGLGQLGNGAYKRLGNQMSVIGQGSETSASLTLRRQPLLLSAVIQTTTKDVIMTLYFTASKCLF